MQPSELHHDKEVAKQWLKSVVGDLPWQGLQTLDIGAGEGGLSLAALDLGARLVSVERTPALSQALAERRKNHPQSAHWKIVEGGYLDQGLFKLQGGFDLVFALGSLEHSGDLTESLRLAVTRVKPGGTLLFSLPAHHEGKGWTSSAWWAFQKKAFHGKSPFSRKVQTTALGLSSKLGLAGSGESDNPYQSLRTNASSLTAWLQDFPYETQPLETTLHFLEHMQFKVASLQTGKGTLPHLFRADRAASA